ncbi:head GIN domain-containing protein [Croceivirga thetidis]|uniref:DUF2807 domain-containing protein n=1 Tax=Croceivirga thetidis TaxID=2721623 RepID=A0ABX1GLK2_9FLAO|nr:head GIN domain-containing protein [Croceivirga thetidis]NKI30494.1 DUF2807 domain-containing protein [Croceivirga thetidis]
MNQFKRIVEIGCLLFWLVLCLSCNSESASDCFQSAGDLVRVEVEVEEFSQITVFELLNLVLIEGDEHKVEIETGEFLLNDIKATVEGERLLLRNENGCNLFRDYELSTVYVTSPNITEIRSSTGLLVSNIGALTYPSLDLISESFFVPEAETTSGSFNLTLDNESVSIVVNGISFFNLSGRTQNLGITVAAGDTRIQAESLEAGTVTINHRGSNDILVNPQERIAGTIRGYGNVISFNRPEVIAVDETFEGRLIFRD